MEECYKKGNGSKKNVFRFRQRNKIKFLDGIAELCGNRRASNERKRMENVDTFDFLTKMRKNFYFRFLYGFFTFSQIQISSFSKRKFIYAKHVAPRIPFIFLFSNLLDDFPHGRKGSYSLTNACCVILPHPHNRLLIRNKIKQLIRLIPSDFSVEVYLIDINALLMVRREEDKEIGCWLFILRWLTFRIECGKSNERQMKNPSWKI